MATGRVLRFDETRGYGFIAPDGGGEDIFMHANALDDDKSAIMPGVLVEFETMAGERGLKASSVRVVRQAGGTPVAVVPTQSGGTGTQAGDEEELSDVLSVGDFLHELTETFLDAAPTLTGTQILQLRHRLVRVAQRHGWVEAG